MFTKFNDTDEIRTENGQIEFNNNVSRDTHEIKEIDVANVSCSLKEARNTSEKVQIHVSNVILKEHSLPWIRPN